MSTKLVRHQTGRSTWMRATSSPTDRDRPDGYVVIEHLPLNLIPMAMQNLTTKIRALGIPLGLRGSTPAAPATMPRTAER